MFQAKAATAVCVFDGCVYVYDVYGSPDPPSARNAFIINDADNARFLDIKLTNSVSLHCRCVCEKTSNRL